MKYGIIGDDQQSPDEKLAQYKGEVDWGYLKNHYENGSLYFVDPSLALETVGAAIVADQKEEVAGWLKRADLVKIEALHVAQWQEGKPLFEALVVSPFVLCRPLESR